MFKLRALPALALSAAFILAAARCTAEPLDAKAINDALSPGINYGNILEANPPEGWGLTAKEGDFAIIAAAGFKSLRLPVRWSAKAAPTAPYTIDPDFALKVEKLVYAAMKAGLYVVLNMHHYDEIFQQPAAHRERFLAIWSQIAARYAKHPRSLLFEPLNEPHDALTPKLWNQYHTEALAEIRKSNPDRVVFIGSAGWGGTEALNELVLPWRDKNIIFTFHHYSPFEFTHQGAEWVGEKSKAWLGKKWWASKAEINQLKGEFEKVKKFNRKFNVPVNLGEYGAYSKGDMESRVKWTTEMSKLAKKFGYSRIYWEFKAGGFGAYDEKAGKWREELKNAIVQ